jgi:hypothetical protein
VRWLQATPHGDVRVSYHRLEPGTFVAFTPQSKDLQKAIQTADMDLEALLQATLMQYTALSEGDWISVTIPSLDTTGGVPLRAPGSLLQHSQPILVTGRLSSDGQCLR